MCVNDRGFKSKVVVRIFVFTFVILKGKTPKTKLKSVSIRRLDI